MREIHSHKVNECNEALTVVVSDLPGAGGANHRYDICGLNLDLNPSLHVPDPRHLKIGDSVRILFQNGPIKEVGTNGITHEVLLAIVADRLECFQKGRFACAENAQALAKVQEALMWLQKRTRDRVVQGVEGTHMTHLSMSDFSTGSKP